MKEAAGAKKLAAASISLGNKVGKIERLPVNKDGQEQIRLSIWSQGKMLPRPPSLSEKELVDLLITAIQAGVLSQDFIRELHSAIEI